MRGEPLLQHHGHLVRLQARAALLLVLGAERHQLLMKASCSFWWSARPGRPTRGSRSPRRSASRSSLRRPPGVLAGPVGEALEDWAGAADDVPAPLLVRRSPPPRLASSRSRSLPALLARAPSGLAVPGPAARLPAHPTPPGAAGGVPVLLRAARPARLPSRRPPRPCLPAARFRTWGSLLDLAPPRRQAAGAPRPQPLDVLYRVIPVVGMGLEDADGDAGGGGSRWSAGMAAPAPRRWPPG